MSNPIPGTGRKRHHRRYPRTGGLLGASRIIRHRFADEGDKGPWYRRVVRKREQNFWRKDVDQ